MLAETPQFPRSFGTHKDGKKHNSSVPVTILLSWNEKRPSLAMVSLMGQKLAITKVA